MRRFDIGYYPEFKLPENFPIPEQLEKVLREAWNHYYSDFNEGSADVMDMCVEVLYYFGSPGRWYSKEHDRYIYMALAFAYAGIPIIERLRPKDTRAERVLNMVSKWFEEKTPNTECWAEKLFPEKATRAGGSFLDEVFDNFYSLLKITNPTLAPNEMEDILYDAFTGEWCGGPICGSGSRDMFNWWLIEVVPAAYNLQLPNTIRPIRWDFPFRCETPEMFEQRMKSYETN